MGGTRGLSWTGLILETWNVGWILMDRGSRRCTASGLMMRAMGKGPTSLRFSTFMGRSRVESQTLRPTW